jgi:phosphoribosyl 1,2-cyclic phosphodiesterase
MKLNVHGCRGSVPVQSKRQIKYGGNTSCFEVTFGKFQIFFDTGTGFRTAQFGRPEITKILLYSHWHHDHVQGFAFNPNIFVPDHKVLVASGLSSADVSRQMLQQYFSGSYFPIDVIGSLENIIFHEFEYIKENFINDFRLNNLSLNHPGGASGYRLEHNKKIICYLSDNEYRGTQFAELKDFVEGANIVIWDGMFTDKELLKKKGWGHSSIDEGINFFEKCDVERLLITHHAPERNDDQLDEISAQLPEHVELAFDGMSCKF